MKAKEKKWKTEKKNWKSLNTEKKQNNSLG